MSAGLAAAYLAELVEARLLIPSGVEGLYGRGGAFEDVVQRVDALITRAGAGDGAEVMRFPPGMNRQHFVESEYLKSFPQLAGTVHSFMGDDRDYVALLGALERGDDWTGTQHPTQVVMIPAACYPVYPALAARGPLPRAGSLVDVLAYCFRHEPSPDPARMQMFRQREYVRVAGRQEVLDFRESWMERGPRLIGSLGLPFTVDVANDPFFGRTGRMLSVGQRESQLKFELLIPITDPAKPTACVSFNCHQDHFGRIWNIRTHDGSAAHTGCVGFGLERITLALFRHHGLRVDAWPPAVRALLWS